MTETRRAPDGPQDLEPRTWRSTLWRTVKAYLDDNLGDRAATLTYYGILSVFPSLLVIVSALGLIGRSVTQPLIHNLETLTPGPANEIVTSALRNIEQSQGAAGVLFVLSLAVALWTASSYVGAFIRTSNAIYGVEEGRPIWKTLPLRLVLTVLLLLVVAVIAVAVTFTGPLAKEAGSVLGVGSEALTAWSVLKWPVVLLGVLTIFAVLYWAAPNVKHPKFRWITPGSLLGLVLWVAATAAFAVYVSNFASYNKTYGALAGAIVFLVWLWISNVAILLGAELNAELERSRAIEAGRPAGEPFLPLREVPS